MHVAAGADFKMDALAAEVLDERGVFNAADAVADAGGLEGSQRFPYAVGAAGFTGVCGAMEAAVLRITECWNVGVDGEAGFVAGDIECGDAGAFELLDEVRGLETLRLVVVAQRAEDEAGFDPGGCDALLGGAIDDGDYGFGSEAVEQMEQRSEADFSVDDMVAGELFEDVFSDDAQRVFCLHQLKAAWGAGEEVGEAGALGWSYEFGVVFSARDGGGEAGDGVVAQGAIEVEMDLNHCVGQTLLRGSHWLCPFYPRSPSARDRGHPLFRSATAGPSTPFDTKYVSNSAQDDSFVYLPNVGVSAQGVNG